MEQTDDEIARATEHHLAGRLREAVEIYQQILARDPRHAGALNLLGVVALQTGQVEAAIELLRRSVHVDSQNPAALNNLGEAFRTAQRFDEAAHAFGHALALNPENVAAHVNLGLTLLDLRRRDDALAHLDRAISLRPAGVASHPKDAVFAQAHSNLGTALIDDDPAGAAENYRRAIELNPRLAEAHTNLGELLRREGQIAAAVDSHRRAVEIEARLAPAYMNLGLALQTGGDVRDAIAVYRQAIAISPQYRDAHDNLLLALHYENEVTPQQMFEEHTRWAAIHTTPAAPPAHQNTREPDRRLKIGYLSGDFREHAVARFLEGTFAQHDPGQVEVFCYSNTSGLDATSQRLRSLAHHWRDVVAMDDAQIARQVRDDQIDILIDLAGHTAHNRLPVFARRPAPVQATYLGVGSPGTELEFAL